MHPVSSGDSRVGVHEHPYLTKQPGELTRRR